MAKLWGLSVLDARKTDIDVDLSWSQLTSTLDLSVEVPSALRINNVEHNQPELDTREALITPGLFLASGPNKSDSEITREELVSYASDVVIDILKNGEGIIEDLNEGRDTSVRVESKRQEQKMPETVDCQQGEGYNGRATEKTPVEIPTVSATYSIQETATKPTSKPDSAAFENYAPHAGGAPDLMTIFDHVAAELEMTLRKPPSAESRHKLTADESENYSPIGGTFAATVETQQEELSGEYQAADLIVDINVPAPGRSRATFNELAPTGSKHLNRAGA
ncbi:hypothetical protein HK102_012303, partial [Quaeritorhiza haematococci]